MSYFKIYTKCEKNEGFYKLPDNYGTYVISESGVVKHTLTGAILKPYITKPVEHKNITGGYRIHKLRINGKQVAVGLHKLLCLAFKEIPDDGVRRVVNHEDGDPSNNHLSNLEWATYSDNLLHALKAGLMPNSVCKVKVKNIVNGEVKNFMSITEAARHYKLSHTLASRRLGKNYIYTDNLYFEKEDNDWKEVINELKPANGTNTLLMSRNHNTGEVLFFLSYSHAGMYLNTCPKAIAKSIREYRKPFRGHTFRVVRDEITWPDYTDDELLLIKRDVSSLVAVYLNNVRVFTGTREEVVSNYGLSAATLDRRRCDGKAHNNYYFKDITFDHHGPSTKQLVDAKTFNCGNLFRGHGTKLLQ